MNPLLILLAGMAVVVGGILGLRLHPFLALLFGALVVAALTPPEAIETFALARGMNEDAARRLAQTPLGERVAEGFGRTCGQIGIVIAMASVIGLCLLESGAADRIVRATLRLLGERRAPAAFVGSGFLLGIPVFFDTVFLLMVPLAKAMRLRTGRSYLFYVLTVVTGATMAHSLVPPTPGPLFVASELRVDIGLMIVAGCVVGLFTSMIGYSFAAWANGRWEVPLRESQEALGRLEDLSRRDESRLPRLGWSLLPILLPVVLIAGSTLYRTLLMPSGPPSPFLQLLDLLGDKNIALTLAAVSALLLLLKFASGRETVASVQAALLGAGGIILITGAGGAFGTVLQQTGIGQTIQELAVEYHLAVLPLAFLLTVLIRTAQGSATVAMITAAGVFGGMAVSADLGFHPVYLALVIGCGSKPVWWMNDSGFWVVTQMSGLQVGEGLKYLTPLSALMGLSGLFLILLASWLFPLV